MTTKAVLSLSRIKVSARLTMLYRNSIAIKQTQRLRKVTVQAYKKERQAYKLMIERYERGAMVSLPQMNGQQLVQTGYRALSRCTGARDGAKLREEAVAFQREANQLCSTLGSQCEDRNLVW